jgi:hypothetical protein
VPASQFEHSDWPGPENTPAAQLVHAVPFAAARKLFSAHSTHELSPALGPNVPGGHRLQLGGWPTASHWLAFHPLALPAGQLSQAVVFVLGWCLPASHVRHASCPGSGWDFPMLHTLHSAAPALPAADPGAQATHRLWPVLF